MSNVTFLVQALGQVVLKPRSAKSNAVFRALERVFFLLGLLQLPSGDGVCLQTALEVPIA